MKNDNKRIVEMKVQTPAGSKIEFQGVVDKATSAKVVSLVNQILRVINGGKQ